jgi:hypothetical protein
VLPSRLLSPLFAFIDHMTAKLIALLLVVAPLASTGCTTQKQPAPTATKVINLKQDRDVTKESVPFNAYVEIVFPAAPAGYTWQLVSHDARYLKQTTEIAPGATDEDGARVSFLTVNPGGTRLLFMLVPPTTGRTAAPVAKQDITLLIR